MTAPLTICFRLFGTVVMLLALLLPSSRGQGPSTENSAIVEGTVCDPQNHALAGATVTLKNTDTGQTLVRSTDSQGGYRFAGLALGTYTLRAKLKGWREANKSQLILGQNQVMSVVLSLQHEDSSESKQNTAQPIEFSIEPTFTVAGVSDPTNLGGHGSDVIVRTKESLAKAAVSLNVANIEQEKQRVAVLRRGQDIAQLHALLGDIAESEGRPLEAVREYQRAAEMEPTEANLYAWGADLLLHRALEPASEVFTKGHRLFPRSARMLVGLGVTSYARGLSGEAAQQLVAACDLDPADPTPYLFLGKIQAAEKTEPPGWTERLKRFADLYPENALAHYYYAVALTKDTKAAECSGLVESALRTAVKLDPQLGDAYIQLGILYASRKDFVKAISAYQKAIETTTSSEEAHFRLAEAYRLTGDRGKAHEEIDLYDRIARQKTQESERERHKIPQFVYTLRGPSSSSPGTDPPPQ